MAGTTSGSVSSSSSSAPKIILARPGLFIAGSAATKFGLPSGSGGVEDDAAFLRSRLPPLGTLNLLSDSWDFQIDRILPILTDNTDFTVIGIIGPPGVGKSTIMNEIYGFNGSSSGGMLPPFPVESEEMRAMARHCTVGIEPRISGERIILLDTQPVYSSSVLAEMTRPDGSSTISFFGGESSSAELVHELLGIQAEMLKHGIADPSSFSVSQFQSLNVGDGKEKKDKAEELGEEYLAVPVFVHTKVGHQDLTPNNFAHMRKALGGCFSSSLFSKRMQSSSSHSELCPDLFLIPPKNKDDSSRSMYHESYNSMMWKLRDQVLLKAHPSFARSVSEREWAKNSGRIWEAVRNCGTIAEYGRMLQSSGMFRR